MCRKIKSIFKPCKFALCVYVCVCGWVGVAQSLFCLQHASGCFCACHAYVMLSAEMRADIWQKSNRKKRKKSAEHLHIAEANCLKRRKTKGISLCTRTTMSSYFKGETHSCTAHSAIWCRVAASLDKSWVYKIWNQSQRRRQKYSIYILSISSSCVCYANVEQHFTPASDRICAAIHLHARQILLIKKLSQCHNQSNCLPTEVINAITHEFILLAAALITLCLCVDLLTSCQLPVASLEWLQIATDQVWHASCRADWPRHATRPEARQSCC